MGDTLAAGTRRVPAVADMGLPLIHPHPSLRHSIRRR
jgi:hypothetical protein